MCWVIIAFAIGLLTTLEANHAWEHRSHRMAPGLCHRLWSMDRVGVVTAEWIATMVSAAVSAQVMAQV